MPPNCKGLSATQYPPAKHTPAYVCADVLHAFVCMCWFNSRIKVVIFYKYFNEIDGSYNDLSSTFITKVCLNSCFIIIGYVQIKYTPSIVN